MGLANFIPKFDGQTLVSLLVGITFTILTFWLGYRKTKGAADERLRIANGELVASLLKRVAVEREILKPEQFSQICAAKAYQKGIKNQRLISFGDAKSIVLADVVDNNFLDTSSKNAIIELIENCKEEAPAVDINEAGEKEPNKTVSAKSAARAVISLTAGLMAASATAIYSSLKKNADLHSFFLFANGLLAAILMAGVLLIVIGLSKEP